MPKCVGLVFLSGLLIAQGCALPRDGDVTGAKSRAEAGSDRGQLIRLTSDQLASLSSLGLRETTDLSDVVDYVPPVAGVSPEGGAQQALAVWIPVVVLVGLAATGSAIAVVPKNANLSSGVDALIPSIDEVETWFFDTPAGTALLSIAVSVRVFADVVSNQAEARHPAGEKLITAAHDMLMRRAAEIFAMTTAARLTPLEQTEVETIALSESEAETRCGDIIRQLGATVDAPRSLVTLAQPCDTGWCATIQFCVEYGTIFPSAYHALALDDDAPLTLRFEHLQRSGDAANVELSDLVRSEGGAQSLLPGQATSFVTQGTIARARITAPSAATIRLTLQRWNERMLQVYR